MPITIRPATLRDMTFIAANMRAADLREIGAVVALGSTEIAAALFIGSNDLAWTAWIGGEPVAAFGIMPGLSGTGSGWAYGTRRMRRAVPAMTRFGIDIAAPMLIDRGFRRVEVRTLIDHDLSHRWLERMGFVREGVAIDYGQDDMDFVTYAARRRDWRA